MRPQQLDTKRLERVNGGRGTIHGYWQCDICGCQISTGTEPDGECPGCLFNSMGAQGW